MHAGKIDISNLWLIFPQKLFLSFTEENSQKLWWYLHSTYITFFSLFITVLRHLVMRILDVPSYDPEKVKATCIVTLHQFLQYFKDEGGLQNVDAVAAECKYNQFV